MRCYICLLHRVHTSIVILEDDCNYIELIDMVVSEIRLDSREVAITMKYILNKALLPICIEMKVII